MDQKSTSYFVYVLKSLSHNTRYVGSTANIEKRLEEHNKGKQRYTKGRRPWKIIYKETYASRAEAMKREKFLKTSKGQRFLNNIFT